MYRTLKIVKHFANIVFEQVGDIVLLAIGIEPFGIECFRCLPEPHYRFVRLVESRQELRNFGGPAETEHKEPFRKGIERTRVTDRALISQSAVSLP